MEKEEVNDQGTEAEATRGDLLKETPNTQATEDQSGTTSEEAVDTPKLYKTPDGRELSADDIYNEYNKLMPEFTRRSQKLSEYEKQTATREARAQEETEKSIEGNELLQGVDPNVKEAIIQIVSPVIKDALMEKDRLAEQRERDRAFDARIQELEGKYTGKDGLPKFDRKEVIMAMQEPDNQIFDPEKKFKDMYEAKFQDYLIKQAIKQKAGDTSTESTSGETPRKPESKTPRDFDQAAQSLLNRLRTTS